MSEMTVKSLAKKYGVSARDIIRELNEQGFENISSVEDVIPAEEAELVESYFNDLYDTDEPVAPKSSRKNNSKTKSGKGNQEKFMAEAPESKRKQEKSSGASTVTVSSPVVVKNLAEALGKKPNEIITELIKLGELAGINQTISDASAKKVCAKFHIAFN